MLTQDERDYLFRIAGESPPPAAWPGREVTPGIRHLLDACPARPAYVLDASYDVLAWNQLATCFIGDLSGYRSDRNMIRWIFLPARQDVLGRRGPARFARSVADLRAAYARYPGDPSIEDLVTELLGVSPRFAAMWAEHEVEVRRPTVKRVDHPAGAARVRLPGAAHPGDRPAADHLLGRAGLADRAGVPPVGRSKHPGHCGRGRNQRGRRVVLRVWLEDTPSPPGRAPSTS